MDLLQRARGAVGAGRQRVRAARFRRQQARSAGARLVRACARARPEAFFIEIGSNDGQQMDHLRPAIRSHEWRGIMVEPVPYIFKRLEANYGDLDRVILENVAIADRNGSRPFYYLKPVEDWWDQGLPDWYETIGSFSKERVLAHGHDIPNIEERIETMEVPCLTFESLCERHGVGGQLDVLVLDTEGYDGEIMRTIDFTRYRPLLVVYEHFHFSAAERRSWLERFAALGYDTLEEGLDTWCLDRDADRRLRRTWSRLRPTLEGLAFEDVER
jgi:FkbM family methyltransferase